MIGTPLHLRFRHRLAAWKAALRDRWRGETASSFFDPHSAADLARIGFVADGSATPEGTQRAALAYQARPDMREAIPLGLTPRDRGLFLKWMAEHGGREVGFTSADALAATLARDSDPSRGLADSYRLQPRWQAAVPDALTPAGWKLLKAWLAAEYGLGSRWFRRATCPRRLDTETEVTVLGFFRYTSGLQQAARGMTAALDAAGVRYALRDVPGPSIREFPTEPLDALETAPVSIVHTGLDLSVAEAYQRAGLHPRPGVYRIANWWWELEDLPTAWLDRGRDVDEIWAPSRFIAEALARLGKPVLPMLPGVELPRFAAKGKAAFGMSADRFTFAVMFDVNSRLARKNPQAAVDAFRRAFRPTDAVELVVKMTPASRPSRAVDELRAACGAANVKLIEAVFSRDDTLAFLAAADAVVSLHRSEGLGLPLAEAMLLGKPAVGTGYSGNLDFMTPTNSYLVDYSRVPIAEDDPPYARGMVWAEPSVEHAAALMRRIAADPEAAKALGMRAKTEVTATLSVAVAGRRMRDRLAEIASRPEAA